MSGPRADLGTKPARTRTRFPASIAAMEHADRPPTVRQIYALAGALCEFTDQEFPRTRGEASDLIERLRIDTGHPRPSLEDREAGPPRPRSGRRGRRERVTEM
jgi:hypothetical protein